MAKRKRLFWLCSLVFGLSGAMSRDIKDSIMAFYIIPASNVNFAYRAGDGL